MRFFSRRIFVLTFTGMIGFVSCKNGDSAPSAKNTLIGKWKIVKITTEENYTQVAGAADDNNITVTFNANGKGSSSSNEGGSAFTWALGDGDKYLNITDSATGTVNYLLLTKVSGTSMTIKDTSTHPAQFEIFKKQNDK